MSYTPTTWKAGDVITATKLNKLEKGVKNAASAAVPAGGAASQILAKKSGTDYDAEWIDPPSGGGTGNVSSSEITTIKVLDRAEFDALPRPLPTNVEYHIKG